jgi:hypothetical protein
MTRAAFSLRVRPISLPAGEGVPYAGGRGDGPGLACPGGGGQQGHGLVRGEQGDDGLVLLVVEVLVVPVELVADLLFGDQGPDRAPGLALLVTS